MSPVFTTLKILINIFYWSFNQKMLKEILVVVQKEKENKKKNL